MTETTADMDVTPEEQPIPVKRDDSIVQPGDLSAKLKACREKAEMDLEQAAVEMRLSTSMVRALEAENFGELPDPPYVRGYLRSYSRLDGSDPKDLIRTYELLRGADPDSFALSSSTQINRIAKPAMSPNTVKLLGLVLLVLFLGILSMIPGVSQWATDTWKDFSAKTAETLPPAAENEALVAKLTREPAADTPSATEADKPASTSDTVTTPVTLATSTQDSPTTDTAGLITTLALPGSTTESEESDSPDADLAAGDTHDAAPPPAEGADQNGASAAATATNTTADTASAGITPIDTAATSPTTAPVTPDVTATTATTTETATDTSTAAPTQDAAPAARQQPIDGEVVVRMEFTQEVWMQIKDSNKKSIFEAVNTAGTWKQFQARTPLSFKVGNSDGVKIYLNGQLFDQAPHSRGSVARFNID